MSESQEKQSGDKKAETALPPNSSQFKQIFLDVAKKNREDFTLLMCLGLWNLTQGYYNEAINDFQAVLDRLNNSEEKIGADFKQFALGQAHHMLAYCKMMKDKTTAEKDKDENLDALIQSIMQSVERASQADARQIGLWNTSALTLILKANDFQQALNVLESLIAKVPNYLDALNNYGVCLMHNDKLEEAALCFNTVLNSNNEHIEALNNLSLILARWNNFEDAIFMANRAYEMASTQKKNELDNMCHDLEDHEDSSLSSTLLFIANNLCCFHLQIGDTNAVTKITEDVGSLLNSSFFQNHPLVDYNVSKLFLRTGNLTPYQSTITKAIDLYPDGMLWAALAEGFEAQRDVNFDDQEAMQDFNNKAIVTFEQAIQHSPNDPLLWNQIGVFYLRQEHYVSAKEAFETAIQLNSQYLNAWSNLALATHLEGTTELEKVESLYLKALLIDPRSVDTMLNFATLYRQHKKYEKATTLLRHCESLGPNNTLVLNNFGLLYQALGDVQQACRYFDKAQQIDPTFEPAKANKEKLSFKPS